MQSKVYEVTSYDSSGAEHDHYGDLSLTRANAIFDNLGLGDRIVSRVIGHNGAGRPILTLSTKVIERIVIEEINVWRDEYVWTLVREKTRANPDN